MSLQSNFHEKGLYDPRFEHDGCGVGFVCRIDGTRTHEIVRSGLEVLSRLSHRGATGSDPLTGDGAGILIQVPHEFIRRECGPIGINLPPPGEYGCGLIFLPKDDLKRKQCKELFAEISRSEGLKVLGWRSVPVNDSGIGQTARQTQPVMEQVFIGGRIETTDELAFERKLYTTRKKIENSAKKLDIAQMSGFYITNLSSRTLIYKGLLMPRQLEEYFTDLSDKNLKSAICLVHSRYSTNTFPTWNLSQPFRYLAHNGEINTLRGNINWMATREGNIASRYFGKDITQLFPIIVPDGSDSASLDNLFELLVLAGRPMEHVMMMLTPAAWERDDSFDNSLKDFYKYHACLIEPWDGPAAVAFTDGLRVGASLDRNGLRPARFIITDEGLVIMASEAGVIDIDAGRIVKSGRLEPGKMLFIDTTLGKMIDDSEIKRSLSRAMPYGKWLKEEMVSLDSIKTPKSKERPIEDIHTGLLAFGYSREDLKMILKPMAESGQEPVGSMGNDTPHAVLSSRPQLLFSYFKQLFAQVTNPAIDPIREEIVMSLAGYIGKEENLLGYGASHCHKLYVKNPILNDEECAKIRHININGLKARTISTLFETGRKNGVTASIDRICAEAEKAIADGASFIILSDRGVDAKLAPLPSLLAASSVHHYLIRKTLRTRAGIIVESGEPREVHHFALLFGYGADCVNPYMAFRAINLLSAQKELSINKPAARRNYIHAINKGLLKILSKMGISTLQSYKAAQIFESLGLGKEVIDRCFTGTSSRIGGMDFDDIEKECLMRHDKAFPANRKIGDLLETGGLYQWKRDGEFHLWNPDSIALLQDAARTGDFDKYRAFACLINNQSGQPCTIRSVLKFKKREPAPLEQVEPASEILKRFATGAMSFGSISRSTHETIAIAMNRIGGRSNTGEGGEDPARFHPLDSGDSARSAIKQVASGRFGVTINYLINADEIQIKIAQGAKPGEGGQLPGHKVSAIIARTRYTTPGVTLISPPPHHDIYSIEDLAQLIFDLKNANPRARISVKLVSEIGVGTIAAGVAKGHADMILISGGDGGTGASPLSSIRHAGLPWELGLSETHQTLVLNDLRSRVRLQTDGQMRTGRDVAIAAALGAEEFGFCTAALVVLGCVMLRHCHLNNCSVGVATQDEMLERRFKGKPEHLINYFNFVAEELREILASLGLRRLDDLIGRTDLLETNTSILPLKAKKLDLSRVLYKPRTEEGVKTRCVMKQDHGVENVLDIKLIELALPSLKDGLHTKIELPIGNTDRTTGAMLSGELCRAHGEEGLNDSAIHCIFRGIAGQSFGAFLAKGITFELEGMANDYVGKGISGGKIIIYPDRKSSFTAEDNIIIGNTAFYGAINGEAYVRGLSGERFCIRNSGLYAVVEGVGDHALEYMTGGVVAILGPTGRNFAAGMSGGTAYVLDIDGKFAKRCNTEMAQLEELDKTDAETLNRLISNHYRFTQSQIAKKILDSFAHELKNFVKVMPLEYKRILEGSAAKTANMAEVSDG